MPVIAPSTPFDVCQGSSEVSVMGAVPAVLVGVNAGNPHWLQANTELLYQNVTAGAILQSLTLPATLATADASGQNGLGAGAGKWAAYLTGVRTNIGGLGPFPAAGLYDVSETGQVAVVDSRATASGLTVYGPTGTQIFHAATTLTNPTVHVRQGLLSYQDMSGWHLVSLSTGAGVPGFQPRANITNLIPFVLGSTAAVLEYDATTATFTIRKATELFGLTVPDVAFNPDVVGTGTTACRIAWSTGASEAADELVILDVNTATGATEEGTVVSGSVVFAAGPTLTGSPFSGSTAQGISLPVQSQKVLNTQGEMAKPWRDALQRISGGVQSTQTSINNLPVTTPPDGFGSIGGVDAPGPNSTLTFTSVDGSVTITPDQPSSSVDFSVVGIAFYMSPLTTGGDPTTAELIFGPDGDVVMVPVAF